MSENKIVNITEGSSGRLISSIQLDPKNKKYVSLSLKASLSSEIYEDLDQIKISTEELTEHLLDLLSALNLLKKGYYDTSLL